MRKLLLLGLLSILSCNDLDFKDIHVVPNTSFPIGKFVISDSNLFNMSDLSSTLSTNSDGVVCFALKDTTTLVDQNTIREIFQMRSQIYDFNITLPNISPISGGSEIPIPPGTKFEFYFNAGDGEEINKLILPNGKLEFKIESDQRFPNLKGRIPQITKNGKAIEFKVGDVIVLDKNYIIAPIKKNGMNNALELELFGSVPIMQYLKGDVTISSDQILYLEGSLGRKVVRSVYTNIVLDNKGFNDFTSQAKYIYFANPRLTIKIDNKYDIPMMIDVSTFIVDGVNVDLKQGLNTSKFLVAPLKTVSIDITNKSTVSGNGVSNAITKDFTNVTLGVSGIANPTKEDLGVPNYIAPTKNIIQLGGFVEAIYEVSLPFEFVLEDVTFSDGVDLDMTSLAENKNNEYQELSIALTGVNEMPMDLKLLPFITNNDQADGIKQYLFTEPILIKGTDSDLKPTLNGFEPYKFYDQNRILRKIDTHTIDDMINSKKIFFDIVTSTVNVKNKKVVKLYSPSKLEMNVFVGAKADIVLNPSKK